MVEPNESLCLKEQLSDDELRSCIHLLLQVEEVLLIAGAVWVAMRVPWEGEEEEGEGEEEREEEEEEEDEEEEEKEKEEREEEEEEEGEREEPI